MPRQFYHSTNWGGFRPGAGRPRVIRDLPTVDVLDQPGFVKPLDHLWARANDPTLDAKYRDALMVKLLPYFHPRLGLYVSRHLQEEVATLSDDDLLRQIAQIISEPGEPLARHMEELGWVRVRTTETVQ